MKAMKIVVKTTFIIFFVFAVSVFSSIFYLNGIVAESYKINKGDTLNIKSRLPVTAVYNGVKLSQSSGQHKVGDTFTVDLKMFGVIPFSTAEVEVIDEMYVALLGNPFGMKIYTQGVLVIELSEVQTQDGKKSPAKDAGIKVGDYVVSVDGVEVSSNENLSELVMASNGRDMNFEIVRNGKKIYCKVTPQKSNENGIYRVGLWVRDSSAGIGTLTFYSPATDVICGLGHGICDSDTGSLLKLESGELVEAQITSITKSADGSPGELSGKFSYSSICDIALNCECGVYGILKGNIDISSLSEIALKQEVEDGAAQILCTVQGETPKLYSCEIKKRSSAYHSKTQNLIVKITDEELIKITGGIVQGMSGSPIIQNGRFVGALTHVLIDEATTGYGIFAENMLETAQSVAENNKLKEAS